MRKIFSVITFLFFLSSLVSSEIKRIVSLTPSITEQLYLLNEGRKVVGITSFCRKLYPEQQIVGTYLQPNIERIVQLAPDIVFISKEGVQKEIVEQIERFNIKVYTFEPVNTYTELVEQFLKLAEILAKKSIAKSVVLYYERYYQQEYQEKFPYKLKTLCVVSLEPLIVASSKSYLGEIISFVGVKNCIVSSIKYPRISVEEMVRCDPDIIFVTDMGYNEKYIKQFFKNKYSQIRAVKNDNIFILNSNIFCQPTIKNFWISVKEIKRKLKISVRKYEVNLQSQ